MSINTKHEKKSLDTLSSKEIREKMVQFERELASVPNAKFGDDCAPLEHSFVDGAYIRKITMPKGMIIVSKIHKVKHPYFVMSGDCSVLTETGIERIKAPYHGITYPGTKRILYMHEETVWITVHVTNETDLDKIEDEIIAKSFDEIDNKSVVSNLIDNKKECEL